MGNKDLSPFGNALAGAFGGIVSSAIVYPLDTIKTKIQADTREAAKALEKSLPEPAVKRNGAPRQIPLSLQRSSMRAVARRILEERGIAGFFRGFSASMLNTFAMQFAFFYWSSVVRNVYTTKVYPAAKGVPAPKSFSTGIELTLSALAGAIASLFLNPVSVVATRQQLEEHSTGQSVWQTIMDILKTDGVTGLWRGIKPSLILTVNPAITYGMFERLKVLVLGEAAKMTPGRAFYIGAMSKTLATVVTFPYIMAKVRLQAKYVEEDDTSAADAGDMPTTQLVTPKKRKHRYDGALDVLRKVYKEKGITGWYQGMQAQIIKAVLAQALLFGIKDAMENYTVIFLAMVSYAQQRLASRLQRAM